MNAQEKWNEARSVVKVVIKNWYDTLSPEDKIRPIAASSFSVITPQSVIDDVLNETEEGIKLVDNWLMLAIEKALKHILNSV
jgi:O-succinylbenzoate synthase